MTQPDIVLSSAEVRAHAERLDRESEQMIEARSAASHVSMQGDAYGVLCSPLIVPLLNGFFENDAVSAIGREADALQSIADLLRQLADNNDRTDQASSERLGGN